MGETTTWPETGARIIFLKVEGLEAGHSLSPSEAAAYAAFRIEKRRKEWLAGRLAAKFLLAETDGIYPCAAERAAGIYPRAAGTKSPDAYEIGHDAFGRPSCGGRLLSISHSNGWALAALKPGENSFLGADLEITEPRHPAWYRDYFNKSELPEPEPSAATRIWTIKEALMKALGLGLMADPLDIRTGGKIQFSGRVLERYKELGSPEFSVEARATPEGFWTAVAAGKRTGPIEIPLQKN